MAIHEATLAKIAADHLVGVLEPHPRHQRGLVGELAVAGHWIKRRQILDLGDFEILSTERRSLVHHTGTILGGDIIRLHHAPRAAIGDIVNEVIEQRFVAHADQIGAGV